MKKKEEPKEETEKETLTKEEDLMKTLANIVIGKDETMVEMKLDFVKSITSHLKANGWDKTFEWIKSQADKFNGSDTLGRRLHHLYHTAYSKMWKLNKIKE